MKNNKESYFDKKNNSAIAFQNFIENLFWRHFDGRYDVIRFSKNYWKSSSTTCSNLSLLY